MEVGYLPLGSSKTYHEIPLVFLELFFLNFLKNVVDFGHDKKSLWYSFETCSIYRIECYMQTSFLT